MNKPVWSDAAPEAVGLHGAGCYKGGVIWSAETSGFAVFFSANYPLAVLLPTARPKRCPAPKPGHCLRGYT